MFSLNLSHRVTMTPVFLALSLSFTFADEIRDASFLKVSGNINKRPDFCVTEGSLRFAFAIRESSNGSCHLVEGRYSSNTTTARPPLFKRVRPGSVLTVLRGRAGSWPHPFALFRRNWTNTTQPAEEVIKSRQDSFKSPLLLLQPLPFSRLQVQLFEKANSTPAVNLAFRVDKNDTLLNGSWFSKDHLEEAAPWNVTEMKNNANISVFSLNHSNRWKLCIAFKKTCSKSFSYMCIAKLKVPCVDDYRRFEEEKHFEFSPNAPKNFTYRKEAFWITILGLFDDTEPVYVRVQWVANRLVLLVQSRCYCSSDLTPFKMTCCRNTISCNWKIQVPV